MGTKINKLREDMQTKERQRLLGVTSQTAMLYKI